MMLEGWRNSVLNCYDCEEKLVALTSCALLAFFLNDHGEILFKISMVTMINDSWLE